MLCRALAPLVGAHERHARLLEQLLVASGSGEGAASPLLPRELASEVARQLLQRAAEAEPGSSADAYLSRVLRALDLRYPAQVDAAVNAALASSAPPAADGAAAPATEDAARRREALFDFVSRCFAGSRHELIGAVERAGGDGGKKKKSKGKGKHQQGDEPASAPADAPLTLAVAVNAAAEGLRAMALERLGAAASDPDAGADVRDLLRGAALRGLSDASLAVASTAAASVAAPGHGVAPAAAEALPALAALMRRCGAMLKSPSAPKPERRLALAAGRAALVAVGRLAAACGSGNEDDLEAATAVLLEWSLSDGRRKVAKLARAAVSAAADALGEGSAAGRPALLAALAAAKAGVQQAAASASADDDQDDNQHQPRTPSKSPHQKSKGGKPQAASRRAASDDEDEDEDGGSSALLRSAAAHNRAVADALGRALSAGGADEAKPFASLYARSAPAARHALVLGLARATTLLSSASPSSSPAAGKKAARGGKKASAAADKGDGLARVAALLVGALLASLRDASLSLAGGAEMASEAARLVDGEGLPTPAHAASLQQPRASQPDAALLCGAAFAAASAAAPAALAAELGGAPGAAVAALAGHAGAGGADAAGALGPLVVLLAGKAAEATGEEAEEHDEGGALSLLSRLFGLPDAVATAASSGAQAASLRLAELAARDSPPDHGSWFLRMLAAGGSSDAAVREAAAAALRALGSGGLEAGSGGKKAPAEHPLLSVCRALAPHLPLVAANPRALSVLLTGALARQAEVAANKTPRGKKAGAAAAGRGRGGAATAAMDVDDDLPALELDARVAEALRAYLRARLPLLDGPACLSAAQLALDCLSLAAGAEEEDGDDDHDDHNDSEDDVAAALRLLPRLVAALRSDAAAAPDADAAALFEGGRLPDPATRELASARAALACRLLRLLRARTGVDETPAPDALLDALAAPLAADASQVRVAALEALTPRAFAGLPGDAYRARALSALLRASAGEGDAAARSAARSALGALPLSAGSLAPLVLRAACDASGSAAGGRGGRTAKKPKKAAGGDDQEGASPPPRAADVDASLPCLELLQWKACVRGAAQLVSPLQAVVAALLPCMGSIAERHAGGDNADEDEDEEAADEPAVGAGASDGPVRPSTAGYAVQLALAVLRRLATGDLVDDEEEEQHAQKQQGRRPAAARTGGVAAGAFDLPLALRAAREAPDAAARNAALSLLTALARLAPESMLQHVIQVSCSFFCARREGGGGGARAAPALRRRGRGEGPMIIPIDSNAFTVADRGGAHAHPRADDPVLVCSL
jgi:U3 small nucleolar RNA-associated protein 10